MDNPNLEGNKPMQQFERLIKRLDGDATFFNNARFPWASKVEERWKEIRLELDTLLSAMEILPGFEEIQVEEREITNDKRWKIFPLVCHDLDFQRNQRRCPKTTEALKLIPNLRLAMFSIFEAGKEVPAHVGPYGGVLRYHLGVKVSRPELCGINVGGDTRSWEEGKSLIFDDSHSHFAWNRSNEDRVVLFVDFDRPLPEHLRARNNLYMTLVRESDFMQNVGIEWAKWEVKNGDRLDSIILK